MVSDKTLLLNGELLKIPLVTYFLVIPVFFLGFHLWLLLRLRQHTKRLNHWFARLEVEERSLYAIQPTSLLADSVLIPSLGLNSINMLKRVIVEALAFFMPLLLLVSIQLRFSDYQNFNVTAFHAFILILDAGLVFYFRPKIFLRNDALVAESQKFNVNLKEPINQTHAKVIYPNHTTRFLSFKRFLRIRHQQKNPISQANQNRRSRLFGGLILNLIVVGILAEAGLTVYLVHKITGDDFLAAEEWINKNYLLVHLPILEVRGEVITEKKNAPNNGALNQTKGLNLQGRYLRYCNLSYSKLNYAELQGVHAEKSKLREMVLAHAKLDNANFSYTDAYRTDFSGSVVEHPEKVGEKAQFNKAFFMYSNLSKSDWRNVVMRGTHFYESTIQGGDLQGAQLQGAAFANVALQGVDFSSAGLEGTIMNNSQLDGVNFSKANLQGIELGKSSVAGAVFQQATLSHWQPNNVSGLDSVFIDATNYRWDEKWKNIQFPKGKLKTSFIRRMKKAEKRIQVIIENSKGAMENCIAARKALFLNETSDIKLENLLISNQDNNGTDNFERFKRINNHELLQLAKEKVKPRYQEFLLSLHYLSNKKYYDEIIANSTSGEKWD